MQQCWETTPEKRRTFEYLSDFFNDYYESTEPNYRSEKLELQLKREGLLSNNVNGARNRTPPTANVTATATAVSAGAMHSSFGPIQASSTPVSVHPQSLLSHPASFVQVVPVSASHAHSLSSPAQQPRAFVPVVPHAAAAAGAACVPVSQLVHASNGSLAGAQPVPIGAGFRLVPNVNGPPLPFVYATPGAVPLQFVAAAAAAAPNLQQLVQQQPSTTGSTSSLPNAVHLQMQQLQLATASATSMQQQQMAAAAAHATKSPLAIQSVTQLPPEHHEIDSCGRSGRDPLAGATSMEDSFIAV